MKRMVCICISLLMCFGLFASNTSVLNLGAEIQPILKVGIVAGTYTEQTFPDSLIGENVQTIGKDVATFTLVVESNQALSYFAAVPYVMVYSGSYMKYTLSHASGSSTVTNETGDYLILLKSTNDPDTPASPARRFMATTFTVDLADTTSETERNQHVFGVDNAPSGTYAGSIAIHYSVV